MKIAFLTDIHGNLPTLQTILEKIQEEECDKVHLFWKSIFHPKLKKIRAKEI